MPKTTGAFVVPRPLMALYIAVCLVAPILFLARLWWVLPLPLVIVGVAFAVVHQRVRRERADSSSRGFQADYDEATARVGRRYGLSLAALLLVALLTLTVLALLEKT